MNIKTSEGMESVSSSATGNTALTLGAIGLGLGILNGSAGILGGNGLFGNRSNDPGANPVTRHELDLVQQLQAKDIQLASKDSEIALKTSESYTDQKMVEIYAALKASENNLRDEVRQNKDAQTAVNAQQMAWNASTGVTMATLGQQIAQVQSIITTVVPASRVCDTGCCCNN